MKNLSLGLFASLTASPALAHGSTDIHTHPEDMLGLAALVSLVVVGGYIAWKKRT